VKINIKLAPGAKLPQRGTEGAAGWDLYANIDKPVAIAPGKVFPVPTGVHVQLPVQTYWDIRVRSGLSNKYGIILANGCGVVDCDYRGEVKAPLPNASDTTYIVHPGDKVAQTLLLPYLLQEFQVVDELEETQRGENGFGHTGR
jgi:dUTP pyrophosphatase